MVGVLCYGLKERRYSYFFSFLCKNDLDILLQRKTQGDEYRLEVRYHYFFPETDTEVTAMVCTFYPKFCFNLLYQLAYTVLWLLQ